MEKRACKIEKIREKKIVKIREKGQKILIS